MKRVKNLNHPIKKRILEYSVKERLNAYNKCIELTETGMSPSEIWKKLRSKGLEIKYETIRVWAKKIRNPYKKLNTIKNEKELSYVIGLLLGDGYFYKVMKRGSYNNGRIVLGVKDEDLAKNFATLISHIFGDKRIYKANWSESRRVYIVEVRSKELVELLLKDFEDLLKFIEGSEASFIRGLFDAEGCINIKYQKGRIYPRIFLTNSDTKIIDFVKSHLKKEGISSNIQINTRAGKEKFILGKKTKTSKDCYNLVIENITGVKKFMEKINFTIKRKREKLNEVISHIEKNGNQIKNYSLSKI